MFLIKERDRRCYIKLILIQSQNAPPINYEVFEMIITFGYCEADFCPPCYHPCEDRIKDMHNWFVTVNML
jgi:hypothetical protein